MTTDRARIRRHLDHGSTTEVRNRSLSLAPYDVFGFLTTSRNAVVCRAIQGDASDFDRRGGVRRLDARTLGRGDGAAAAIPDDAIRIVLRGADKEETAAAA